MENFERVSIKFRHRSCNTIVHSLTKLALEKCETVVMEGFIPSTSDVSFFHFALIEISFQKKKVPQTITR